MKIWSFERPGLETAGVGRSQNNITSLGAWWRVTGAGRYRPGHDSQSKDGMRPPGGREYKKGPTQSSEDSTPVVKRSQRRERGWDNMFKRKKSWGQGERMQKGPGVSRTMGMLPRAKQGCARMGPAL